MLHAYADSDQRRAATTVGGIDIPVQATMTSRLKQAGTHCISAAWSLASLPVQCAYAGKIKLPQNWIISSVELHKSRCHYITVIIALYYITFALTCQLSERFNSFDSLITARNSAVTYKPRLLGWRSGWPLEIRLSTVSCVTMPNLVLIGTSDLRRSAGKIRPLASIIGTDRDRSTTYDLLLVMHVQFPEINGVFVQNSKFFLSRCI